MTFSRSVCAAAMLMFICTVKADPPLLNYTIGTGSKGATFYPVATALCLYIDKAALDFTCEAIESPGASYNLQGLQRGEFDLAMSQLSLQHQAWLGVAPFDQRHDNLRTLAPLYREIFILAVSPGLHVEELGDLEGKRLNIGNEGSGSRVLVEKLLQHLEIDQARFELSGARSAALPELLCNKEIDAAIYSTGHPNAIYRQMIEQCGVELVDLWDDEIAAFVESDNALTKAVIPATTYRGIAGDRYGIGLQVVISAHRELPPAHVAKIFEILFTQKVSLSQVMPVYKTVEIDGRPLKNAAPNHPGVDQYLERENATSQ